MATVNFSVPDEVKRAFNEAFANQNKSAIIAELMMHAVERQKIRQQRSCAIDELLARRASRQPVTQEEIRIAREEGRP
jgi:predicted transcriptional regulator